MDKAEVIAEIKALIAKETVAPDDITVNDLVKALNRSHHFVRDRMAILVEDGVYGSVLKFDPLTRRNCTVYWKVEGPHP